MEINAIAVNRGFLALGLLIVGSIVQLNAIQILNDPNNLSGPYTTNTSMPTDSQVPNWSTGWGASGITGINYLGRTNITGQSPGTGNGIVYLGNGWALTANHVFLNPTYTFTSVTIGGISYNLSGVNHNITNQGVAYTGTQSDVRLFQINPTNGSLPNLPTLSLRHDPIVWGNSRNNTMGTNVVILGVGGMPAGQYNWGYGEATLPANNSMQTPTAPYITTYTYAFGADIGSVYHPMVSNRAKIVSGDSGSPDFVFNSVTQQWELAGINHAASGDGFGGYRNLMADLSQYANQIEAITAVPEPSLILTSLTLFGVIVSIMKKRNSSGGSHQIAPLS